MTTIVLNGTTHIESQLPKNAPKWPSMEAPPSYHESMELTTAVLSPPIIDHRSGGMIGNPVEETDNRTTNSSRNSESKMLFNYCIKCCVWALVVLLLYLLLIKKFLLIS